MSDTPETDARIQVNAKKYSGELVAAAFARELERKNNELRIERAIQNATATASAKMLLANIDERIKLIADLENETKWANQYYGDWVAERDARIAKEGGLEPMCKTCEQLRIAAADRILQIEALQAQIHDLCHDQHTQGPVTPEAFCKGCEEFQMKLFGRSPIAELNAENERLRREHALMRDWIDRTFANKSVFMEPPVLS